MPLWLQISPPPPSYFKIRPGADWLHSGPPGNDSCWGPSQCFGEGVGPLKWWGPGQCPIAHIRPVRPCLRLWFYIGYRLHTSRDNVKEILCENTILSISKLCPCVSVRWCFIELVWCLKSKTSSSFWVINQNSQQDFRVLRPSISLPLHSSKRVETIFTVFKIQ